MSTVFTRNQLRNQEVLVAGCGRSGAYLAAVLSEAGYGILVVGKQESAFKHLSGSSQGLEIEGDAADMNVLETCGINHRNIVLVATDNDSINYMTTQIAVTICHIEQMYIRLNDPDKEKLLEQTSTQAIYPTRLSVQEFE